MADVPAVDEALPDLLAALRESGIPFKVVGGLAVIHHGYRRLTEDIDIIIDATERHRIDPFPDGSFRWERRNRLIHEPTDVRVDVLESGEALARRPDHVFPRPQDMAASPRDGEYVDLLPLVRLKLLAGRRQDEADVVALLKPSPA